MVRPQKIAEITKGHCRAHEALPNSQFPTPYAPSVLFEVHLMPRHPALDLHGPQDAPNNHHLQITGEEEDPVSQGWRIRRSILGKVLLINPLSPPSAWCYPLYRH